jgi:transcriptional regulator with XRE-family HTH domain
MFLMVPYERTNELAHYRKRMKFTQPEVARLLGWKNIKGLSQMESGRTLPTLVTALKLSIIYRVPTEFLYKVLYERLREQIRAKELALVPVGQQSLPLTYNEYAQHS